MNLFKFFFPKTYARINELERTVIFQSELANAGRDQFSAAIVAQREELYNAHSLIAEQAGLLNDLSLELKRRELDINRMDELVKDLPNIRYDIRQIKRSRIRGIKVRDEILGRIETLEKARNAQADIVGRITKKVAELVRRADTADAVEEVKVPPVFIGFSVIAVTEMRGAYPHDDLMSLHDVYQNVLKDNDRARFSFQAFVGKVQSMGVHSDSGREHKGRDIGLYNVNRLQRVFMALGVHHINPIHVAKYLEARK